MSKWGDLWKIIKDKSKAALLSESTWDKADKEVRKRLDGMRDKAVVKACATCGWDASGCTHPDKATGCGPKLENWKGSKSGLADPVSLAIVAGVCLLFGVVFGHGVTTRSIIVNQTVRISGDSNTVVMVSNTNVIDVSGSGGVSIPVSGAK